MGEIGIVKQIDINNEMQEAYLDYAMSVIVSRALPDVRDGLKPVHRRILYAMYDMGLRPDRPYKKSARIVGEVLGKYHPHGDAAVYDTMVRLAQDFSMRHPLVDGQGNFGSVDGDSAAAMRYTEARLAAPAMDMLVDIEKQTVDFSDNFDGSLQEPDVLPAALPNLLINGSSGIAVGMSTNIPPHNLGEICDASVFLLNNYERIDEVTAEDLMRFVQGPDFPTGGIVYRYRDDRDHDSADTILNAYATGRGSLVVQARTHVEEMSRGRSRLVVTELPYQTNKSNLIERIADLAREGRIEGITDLRDESDRRGMRVVIELTRNVEASKVLAQLFKMTPLRQTFGVNLLALVEGQPRLLSLKRALQLFLEHRHEVIRRRSEYDLARARDRLHIVEGLRIALDNLDAVIETIRRSRSTETARQNLIKRFTLTEIQANAILDIQLRRLAQLERRKIEDEYKELLNTIKYLTALLADVTKIRGVISAELLRLKETYNEPRRTQIVTEAEYTGEVRQDALIPNQVVLVTVTQRGEIQRQLQADRLPRRGGDFAHIATMQNRNELLLLTSKGRGFRHPIYLLPEKTGRSNGESLAQVITSWEKGEVLGVMVEIPQGSLEDRYLNLITRQGKVMRIAGSELSAIHQGTLVINVEDKDELIWAGLTHGKDEILMVSRKGQGIRFHEEDVRPMGLGAMGVAGIKLDEQKDAVVGAGATNEGDELLIISDRGLGKRTLIADFNLQGRYGKGLQAMRLHPQRTGLLGAAAVVQATDKATIFTAKRITQDIDLKQVPTGDRYATGDQLLELAERDMVSSLVKWRLQLDPDVGTEPATTNDDVESENEEASPHQMTLALNEPSSQVRSNPKATQSGKQRTASAPASDDGESPDTDPEAVANRGKSRRASVTSKGSRPTTSQSEPATPKTSASKKKQR